MGDSEEGGGGSVKWKVEARNSNNASHKHDQGEVEQEGTDEDGAVDTDFTVSVLVPEDVDPDDFLQYLKDQLQLTNNKKRVYFNHPIQDEEAQIRVSWGQSNHHEGNGGQPTQFPNPLPQRS